MSFEHPAPTAPKPPYKKEPTGKSAFPLFLAIVFLSMIVLSVIAERSGKPAAAATPAPAVAPEAVPVATPATPPPVHATIDDVKGVKGELDALVKKIEAMPKPEPAPDLKPIQEKLDGLMTKSTDASKSADNVAAKLAASEKTVAAVKGEVDAIKAEIAAMKEAMKAKPVVEESKPNPVMDVAAMTAAVDLFKTGKYGDALAAFKKLPAEDARVLYYSALSTGMSTQKWDGEAMELVTKGQKAEKAGTPAKADIDAAFATMTDAKTKQWLDYYRALVK